MYASTASITHNNGIQLSLEQTLAPASSTTSGSSLKTKSTKNNNLSNITYYSGSAGSSGSTSSTGTNSSGGDTASNGKVGHHLNNAFYLNNMRSPPPMACQPLPPPYVNNHLTSGPPPPPAASLPASVRATPTADFELYPRHLRTNSYTQATQHFLSANHAAAIQSTPLHRRFVPNSEQFQLRPLRSDSCNSIGPQQSHLPSNSSRQQQQLLYDKLHGRQSSSSAG